MDSPAVQLDQLTKTYGRVRALDNLSLTIQPGEAVALLGPNGAGKSTATEVMLGLTRPDSGRARLFGGAAVPAVRAGRVGAMLQAGALLESVTVGRMLKLARGLHVRALPLAEVVERAGVGDILSTRTTKLSGGQAQRARFALALLSDPDLLLLDEPTVGMDVTARRAFWDQMRGIADRDRTIVFATHYLPEADEFADRIVLMAHGRVVADGTPAQLKQRFGTTVVSLRTDDATGDTDWQQLPGVTDVDLDGHQVRLTTDDSDATLRAAVRRPGTRDYALSTTSLEDVFVRITGEDAPTETDEPADHAA
ncbi:ABC transporter ATP-binding protein [Parenemella sanctibonifatiensis]|uniref:ABC transporter ATP-binding protein n=1 Tax=Parenemella sanctibonifatiensis TaxID=2016505 RepID=A0A255EM77_9ACTN|nr:ABC transporter ATP-binding protein [Parenemella sanctibonifatiensis]OYN92091.1 ABC transporter ATP-binding protein [Parenemella sanctibonifatiensis]